MLLFKSSSRFSTLAVWKSGKAIVDIVMAMITIKAEWNYEGTSMSYDGPY